MEPVVIVRLTSMAEVIGGLTNDVSFTDETGKGVQLKEPFLIQTVMDPQTRQPRLALQPMLAFSKDNSVYIKANAVAYVYNADSKLAEAYVESIKQHMAQRSGIVGVQPSKILT